MLSFRRNYMKLVFTLVLSLLAAEGSALTEKQAVYSCSDCRLSFEPRGEHLWSIHHENFAQAGPECECQPPCEWISAGVMKLKECVPVNQTSWYPIGENQVREERTYYSVQPRSAAPSGLQVQGLFWLLLLLQRALG